jgi:hypothetical protein
MPAAGDEQEMALGGRRNRKQVVRSHTIPRATASNCCPHRPDGSTLIRKSSQSCSSASIGADAIE